MTLPSCFTQSHQSSGLPTVMVLNPHCHSSNVPLWSHGCVASVSQSYGAIHTDWCKTNRWQLSEARSISTGKEPRWQPQLCSFFHFKVKCIYFPLVNLHSVLCLWALFRFVLLLGAGYERLQKKKRGDKHRVPSYVKNSSFHWKQVEHV